MYENYLPIPAACPITWREYFDALQHVPAVDGSNAKDVPHLPWSTRSLNAPRQGGTKVVVASADAEMICKRTAVQQLIAAYRQRGQRWGRLISSALSAPTFLELEPSFYGFSDADQRPCSM